MSLFLYKRTKDKLNLLQLNLGKKSLFQDKQYFNVRKGYTLLQVKSRLFFPKWDQQNNKQYIKINNAPCWHSTFSACFPMRNDTRTCWSWTWSVCRVSQCHTPITHPCKSVLRCPGKSRVGSESAIMIMKGIVWLDIID